MQLLYEIINALAIWLLLGSGFAFVEYELGRWGEMEKAKFQHRMLYYGPLFWTVCLFFALVDWRGRRAAAH